MALALPSQAFLLCTEALVDAFAATTGDFSSIHMDVEFARLGRYRRRVVHGMLPVFCLLARQGRDIVEINCRFLAPAFPGDKLALTLDAPDGSGWETLRIVCPARETTVSSGKVRFKSIAGPSVAAGSDAALVTSVMQAEHAIASLAVGQQEALDVRLGDQSMAATWVLAFPYEAMPTLAPALLSLLPLSTLIGMRLPGRAATFSEFSARFEGAITADASLELRGTIEKIHLSSRRIQLGIQWTRNGVLAGVGQATTLVNDDAPEDISCADIRARHMDMGLSGRVALITGASRGIGAASARLLAMQGAVVAVHYFQGRNAADAVVADIKSAGGRASAFGADLRDAAQVSALFAQVESVLGPVDILVNNAVGEFAPKAFEATTPQDLQAELDVSLLGLHACCRVAAAGMRLRRRGRIVNLGTVATHLPAGGQLRYIAAKSAVEGYTRALAAELAADNVQVNLVVPAMTRTSLLASLPVPLVQRLGAENPHGRLLEPIEVAQAIVILCSDWTQALSGQKLVLNQGMAPFL